MNQRAGNKINFYQYPDKKNVGDNLGQPILEFFLPDYEINQVPENTPYKMCCIGSVMSKVRDSDVIWGVGCIRDISLNIRAKFLSVRGKLTRKLIRGSYVPEVYGDPALLLPLIFHPVVKKTNNVGYVPHYVDKHLFKNRKFIDVALPWKQFVIEILKCKKIISSSLHGIVIAEAYGIPAEWAVYSDKVIGGGFKFKDYLTGTGREIQEPGLFPPIPNLPEIQIKLIESLRNYYDYSKK